MVRVLKSPKVPRPYRFVCVGCNAKLEAQPGEGRFVAGDRDGDAIVFTCPECRRQNWVAASILPGWRKR